MKGWLWTDLGAGICAASASGQPQSPVEVRRDGCIVLADPAEPGSALIRVQGGPNPSQARLLVLEPNTPLKRLLARQRGHQVDLLYDRGDPSRAPVLVGLLARGVGGERWVRSYDEVNARVVTELLGGGVDAAGQCWGTQSAVMPSVDSTQRIPASRTSASQAMATTRTLPSRPLRPQLRLRGHGLLILARVMEPGSRWGAGPRAGSSDGLQPASRCRH